MEEYVFDFLDKVQLFFIFQSRKRVIKKICKNNNISQEWSNHYIMIQKKLVYLLKSTMNERKVKKGKIHESTYHSFIIGRVFQLNNEFTKVIEKGLFHSALALARKITELFITISYIRFVNYQYMNVLIGKVKGNPRLSCSTMLNKLKKKRKDDYYDHIQFDWEHFSGMFHPTQKSFANNAWKLLPGEGKMKKTKLLIEDFNQNEGESIVIFMNTLYLSSLEKDHLINRGYVYLAATLDLCKQTVGEISEPI